jgi:hypothetical protein
LPPGAPTPSPQADPTGHKNEQGGAPGVSLLGCGEGTRSIHRQRGTMPNWLRECCFPLPFQRKGSGRIDTNSFGCVTANKKTSTPRFAPPARRSRPSLTLRGHRTGPAPPWLASLHHLCPLGAFHSLPLLLPLALGLSSGGGVGWGAGWPCGAEGWWWLCSGVVLRGPPCSPAGPGGPRRGPGAGPLRPPRLRLGRLELPAPPAACGVKRRRRLGPFSLVPLPRPCSVCSGCFFCLFLSAPLPLSLSLSLPVVLSLSLSLSLPVCLHCPLFPGILLLPRAPRAPGILRGSVAALLRC